MGKHRGRQESATAETPTTGDLDARAVELRRLAAELDRKAGEVRALIGELRDARTDAHGVLGDIRRERKRLAADIRKGFEDLVKDNAAGVLSELTAGVNEYLETANGRIDRLTKELLAEIHHYGEKTTTTMRRIAESAGATDTTAAAIAVGVMNALGGTFKVPGTNVAFHLVEQVGGPGMPGADGSTVRSTYKFPDEFPLDDGMKQVQAWVDSEAQKVNPEFHNLGFGRAPDVLKRDQQVAVAWPLRGPDGRMRDK